MGYEQFLKQFIRDVAEIDAIISFDGKDRPIFLYDENVACLIEPIEGVYSDDNIHKVTQAKVKAYSTSRNTLDSFINTIVSGVRNYSSSNVYRKLDTNIILDKPAHCYQFYKSGDTYTKISENPLSANITSSYYYFGIYAWQGVVGLYNLKNKTSAVGSLTLTPYNTVNSPSDVIEFDVFTLNGYSVDDFDGKTESELNNMRTVISHFSYTLSSWDAAVSQSSNFLNEISTLLGRESKEKYFGLSINIPSASTNYYVYGYHSTGQTDPLVAPYINVQCAYDENEPLSLFILDITNKNYLTLYETELTIRGLYAND